MFVASKEVGSRPDVPPPDIKGTAGMRLEEEPQQAPLRVDTDPDVLHQDTYINDLRDDR